MLWERTGPKHDATSGLLGTACATDAGAALVLSAQPLWCKLYGLKNLLKKKKKRNETAVSDKAWGKDAGTRI